MQQLSEMDCNFLQNESVRTPMHISPVIIYDQSTRSGGPVKFRDILEAFRCNLHKAAVFRRKLAGGAMGLDTPYWVEDPDFNLEFHVRHIALPRPGDWRQLCIQLARLHARGLDMKRPLWEAYVIEGLNDVEGVPAKSFAIMLKIHHAAIDGVSGVEIISAIHSLTREVQPAAIVDTWKGEDEPSPWRVWSRAYLHNLQRPVKFFEKAAHLLPAVIRANQLQADEEKTGRSPMVRTRFNGRVSSSRVTDAVIMDLAEIKAIRKAVDGATVNDVIIAIVGGGLRQYLSSKDELPDISLACGAPISMRNEQDSETGGNQVSQMTVSLATDLEKPLDRLRAVHQSATESKAYSEALGTSVLMDFTEVMIPQVLGWGMRTASFAAAGTEMPVPSHVVVSNVPGPQVPLYLAGARVHLMMGMGPLLHMMGMFHAVLSAGGRMTINFTSCREMLPDPEFYRQCLQVSFEELLLAAKNARTGARRKTGKKTRAKARPRGGNKQRSTNKAKA